MTETSTSSPGKLLFFRASALAVALLAIVQPLLAIPALTSSGPVNAWHGVLGNLSVLVALVAAVAAAVWVRAGGRRPLMHHAFSLPVLALVQVALGELHLTMVHITLGVAYLVAAVALATLVWRKP